MGLIARIRYRADVWQWRVRYWWLDTESGAEWHVVFFCMSVLVLIMQLIKLALEALLPPPPDEPVKSIAWWVVQLIIAIVSAIISYALRPKQEPPKPDAGEAPVVEDGQAVIEVHGDVWIEDEFILAHKVVRRSKIKAKGKK